MEEGGWDVVEGKIALVVVCSYRCSNRCIQRGQLLEATETDLLSTFFEC